MGQDARIVGSRVLPCHGARAARLVVSAAPVTRSCPVCRARYRIAFVPEPRLSERIGVEAYRLEIVPWVDGRSARRAEREAEHDAREPRLPFTGW
ncbi:MAG: hypothetical protein M0Z33_05165 [Actinomycetota bacterium]|nr:hypothetical protein [Actinomycetota bacterium]